MDSYSFIRPLIFLLRSVRSDISCFMSASGSRCGFYDIKEFYKSFLVGFSRFGGIIFVATFDSHPLFFRSSFGDSTAKALILLDICPRHSIKSVYL